MSKLSAVYSNKSLSDGQRKKEFEQVASEWALHVDQFSSFEITSNTVLH